jgi:hypothetical protein
MPGGPELITTFLAVASTGAFAPLDPTLTEAEYHFYRSRPGARASGFGHLSMERRIDCFTPACRPFTARAVNEYPIGSSFRVASIMWRALSHSLRQ